MKPFVLNSTYKRPLIVYINIGFSTYIFNECSMIADKDSEFGDYRTLKLKSI